MHETIQYFQVKYPAGYYYDLIIPSLDSILINAKKNGIILKFIDPHTKNEFPAPSSKEMHDTIMENTPVTLIVTKNGLRAKLEIIISFIKLYPEHPLKMKLHRDEELPSVDYVAYLKLLLILCNDLDISRLETKN